MKRRVAIVMCVGMVLGLTACSADSLNNALNSAADKAGVDVEVNIKQEQIDSVTDKAKDAAGTVKDILTDEDVKKTTKDLFDSISDAAGKHKGE